MKRFALFLLGILFLVLAGCGGGSGSSGTPTNPFRGSYSGPLTRSASSILLVSIGSNGATEAIVSDETGVVDRGTGTTTHDGAVSVDMTGTAGDTALSGGFARANNDLQANLAGGIAQSGVALAKLNGGTNNAFTGKYKVTFQGSSTGELNLTVTKDGKVYRRTGGAQLLIGSITPGGQITFSKTGLVTPADKTTEWKGELFLLPNSTSGTGTWKDSADDNFRGAWTATPDSPDDPVFSNVTAMKDVDGLPASLFGVSPNGHVVGVVGGGKAVYYENPAADPIILNPYSGTNIAYAQGVNNAGIVVGYSYNADHVDQSQAVYWEGNSPTPRVLPYPEEYVAGIANSINASGVVVGIIRKASGATKPAIWPSVTSVPIIPPEGDAVNISDAGAVLCQANNGYLPSIDAIKMIRLFPSVGLGQVQLQAMGANGIVVGAGETETDVFRPAAWNPPSYAAQALAEYSGFASNIPLAAGSDGSFAGRGKPANAAAFQALYWKNANTVKLLDDVVGGNSIEFQFGQFILADGSVIAYGKEPSGFPVYAWLQKG